MYYSVTKLYSLLFIFFVFSITAAAQKVFTKSANISFFSKTPIENIDAVNKSATCVMDLATGKMEFAVLIKGFQFDRSLMQEHFNENYMESSKFPKAVFKGQIDNYKTLDLTKTAKIPVIVSGQMTMHGVTNNIKTTGTVSTGGGKVTLDSSFDILLADYKIDIPALVKDQISKSIKITINAPLEALK